MDILKEGHSNSKLQKKFLIGIPIVIILLIVAGIVGYSYYKPLSLYKRAMQSFNDGNYEVAMEQFESLGDYENSEDMVLEVKYKEAERLFCEGKFFDSREILKKIMSVKDVAELWDKIDIMEEYYGTWSNVLKDKKIIINMLNVTIFDNNNYTNLTLNSIDEIKKMFLLDKNNHIRYGDNNEWYSKDSFSVDIPKSLSNPYIGMSENDLINYSTWGKPKKINRTTTKYGVHEQWVYSDNRYVYLDNGVVTAIQE